LAHQLEEEAGGGVEDTVKEGVGFHSVLATVRRLGSLVV
jgi:hypothetical protein